MSHEETVCIDPPSSINPVALTDAIITGTDIGKTKIESITSLALVVEDMAEKIVPIIVKPKVPNKITNPKGKRKGRKFLLYRIVNISNVNISIMAVKISAPIIFARKISQGLTGQSSSPGSVPLSLSTPKDRLNPKRPEKINAIQRIPGMIPLILFNSVPKAKLNIIRIRNEKRHIERINSLDLSSDKRSFHKIACCFWMKLAKALERAMLFLL